MADPIGSRGAASSSDKRPNEDGAPLGPRASVRLTDGTVWPLPTDPREVQWRLRYGTPTRTDLLVAASFMHAYGYLVLETDVKRRNQVIRELRRASRG